jgi:hypothetical protein
MNERIQKLYQQSHITTTQQLRKGGWDNDREPFEYHTVTETAFSPEKFAELIVKECATLCNDIGKEAHKAWKTKYIPHDDGRSDGACQCETAILEHFGVKE